MPANVQGCSGPGKMAAACPGNRLTAFALPQNLVDLARVLIFAPIGFATWCRGRVTCNGGTLTNDWHNDANERYSSTPLPRKSEVLLA